jgi:hypothetical protein
MNFLTNVLWIAIGMTLTSLARSYLRTGPKSVGLSLGLLGAAALGAGFFL